MNEDVKTCVDARVDFFEKYYEIPEEMENEVAAFINDVGKLGENCGDAAVFEKEFVSTGLSERFTTILPKCIPKSAKMTKEQKRHSRNVAKDILRDNKEYFIKDAVKNAGSTIFTDIKDEGITKNRERMIEDGTFDDYARESNRVEDVKGLFGFLSKKLGK